MRPAAVLRGAVLLLLLAAAPLWASSEEEEAARELFRLSNQARVAQGLPELAWDDRLAQAAREHAERMAQEGELSHQFPGEAPLRERVAAQLLRFNATAENVGFGGSVTTVHEGWMESEGHRHNILDPMYNALGVATVRRGRRLYAVQNFAHRLDEFSNDDVEGIVARELAQERARRRLAKLKRVEGSRLRRLACDMAEGDRLAAKGLAATIPGVSMVYTFTASNPARLPEALPSAPKPAVRSFAVGACFARTPRYPEGTNWVVVAFY